MLYASSLYICGLLIGFESDMDRTFFSAMVPEHRINIHIKRLLQAGHRVGVVRQTETAALKKIGDNRSGPFERKLTNLYTLATWVDDLETEDHVVAESSDPSAIVCIIERRKEGKGTDEKVHLGLLAVQPSTGDIIYDGMQQMCHAM